MTTTVNSKGEITVPSQSREALGLTTGTTLEIELIEGGDLVARKTGKDSFFAPFEWLATKKKAPDATSLEAMEVLRGEVEAAGAEFVRPNRRSSKSKERMLADFLIGAHALNQADNLLTRDRGNYQTYFPRLKLITP